MIVALQHQKGGVGKTMLSLQLAQVFGQNGLNVLLIDADTQASASDWLLIREAAGAPAPAFTVLAITNTTITSQVARLNQQYDMIVVDSPPRSNVLAKAIMAVSDLMLIPLKASGTDVRAIAGLLELKAEVEAVRGENSVKCAYALNQVVTGSLLLDAVRDDLGSSSIPVCRTSIVNRQIYAQSMTTGYTVFDYPRGMPAYDSDVLDRSRDEITRLAKEVSEMLA